MMRFKCHVSPESNARIVALFLAVVLAVTTPAIAADSVETAGDILQLVLPAAAAATTLYYKDIDGTWEFAESAALTLGVTYALKYSINERRPDGGSQSFPSGHTSISVSSAEFLRERYGWEYGAPAYGLAAFTGYSRVESKRHYVGDVLAGAAIGFASSYVFTTPYEKWQVTAETGGGYYGIRACRAF